MIYELRIYYTPPGKLQALHKRFVDATFDLFHKHDLKITDFWDDAGGEEKLYYVLEHKDIETRDKNFAAFASDPDWIEAERRSVVDGPIVDKVDSFYMSKVPFR
jgi:hypothetical protein